MPTRVVALICGAPGASQLWTLKSIANLPCVLHVIQALQATTIPKWKRARRLVKEYGLGQTASRFLGGRVGAWVERREEQLLNELFDLRALDDWWRQSGIQPNSVFALNHAECEDSLTSLAPDIIVRVSGGLLKPRIFTKARLATLNIHHGQAPLIRGMWSIPWGIVEGRRDWIGATVHLIDEGIDTGAILWRGSPQVAPGDTSAELFFRVHMEAVAALTALIDKYARGETPQPWQAPPGETSTYRSAPGLLEWAKFLYLGEGRRAPVVTERGLGC